MTIEDNICIKAAKLYLKEFNIKDKVIDIYNFITDDIAPEGFSLR